uniref:Uncharacterized protein n=1 Tax=Leersia perrieri TaxID=77586 RepID=A0A0D9VNZ4_9ORYZ
MAIHHIQPARPRNRRRAIPPAAVDDAPRGPRTLPGPWQAAGIRPLLQPLNRRLRPRPSPALQGSLRSRLRRRPPPAAARPRLRNPPPPPLHRRHPRLPAPGDPPKVAFATSGEQRWRVSTWSYNQFSSPLPFQGKLYMVHHYITCGEPEILQIDPPTPAGRRRRDRTLVATTKVDCQIASSQTRYRAFVPSGRM